MHHKNKKKGVIAMKVIDKSGNVIMEVNRPHIAHARMGTARVCKCENWTRKQYKVVSKEDFDVGLY